MGKGGRVILHVVPCLAEGEVDVDAVLRAESGVGQCRAHRGNVVGREAIGLEVGKAPPRLAEARLERESGAIGGDRFIDPAYRFQHGTNAEVQLGLRQRLAQHLATGRDGLLEPVEQTENGCL